MQSRPVRAAFALLLPAMALLPAATAPAAARPAEGRKVAVTAADLLRLAEDFTRRGSPADARNLLLILSNDPDPHIRNEARYRRAILLEKEGGLSSAAVLLRQVLDQSPNAAAVRLKLATLLHKMGDEESARRELRALSSADLPPNVARYVERMAASLRSTKPFGLQVELALAPDSNINRATRSDTLGTVFGDFAFDKDSKAKSGLGAAARVRAQGRLALSDSVALVARASLDANLYRHTAFNDIGLEVAAGPQWRFGGIRLSAEGGAGEQWYGMKPYQRSLRLAVSAAAPIGPVMQLRVDASARHADNRINDLQDGRGVSAQVALERALSPSLLVAGTVGADRFKAADAAYSTRSWRAGIAAYREMGSTTDDRLQLLPQARSDRSLRLSVGAVHRRLAVAGFAPLTRLVIERNRSTVEFYDYNRVRTEFGIVRAF
jgi:outer membrane protein